jgi:hypothetical protein
MLALRDLCSPCGVLCSPCGVYARLAEFMLAIRFLRAHKKKQPPLLLSFFITL